MCGLCGIINIDGRPVARAVLEAMNRTMTHRGPDGEGYYANAKSIVQRVMSRELGAGSGELGGLGMARGMWGWDIGT
jgi:asparagine synthetase B (glutamine-hydrolysing)